MACRKTLRYATSPIKPMRNGVVTVTTSHDNVFILHDEYHMITEYFQVYMPILLQYVLKALYYDYYIKKMDMIHGSTAPIFQFFCILISTITTQT
jgi:hypothetical protein